MLEIAVCIPTFRRPNNLERLLGALAKLETHAQVIVIVADNDAENHEGFNLCLKLKEQGYRWPLDCVIAAERGIAQARNVLVERALSHQAVAFAAMIDDDEWPAPHWLEAFLAVQEQTQAEVLGGSIRFEGESFARWAEGFDGVSSIARPSGPADMLEGAGNILISRRAVETMARPWFDPAFGLTGGEDRDFFERLKRAGCRFAWAGEALATTVVPQVRITLKWVLTRAYRIGNTEMRIFLKYRPTLCARMREYAKIALALLLLPVLSVILTPFPNRAADALRRLFRNAGKVTALFGRRHNEYAVTHGD